jgi:hypothetical protein
MDSSLYLYLYTVFRVDTIQNVKDKLEVETALDGFFAAISHHASSNHMALSNAEVSRLSSLRLTLIFG